LFNPQVSAGEGSKYRFVVPHAVSFGFRVAIPSTANEAASPCLLQVPCRWPPTTSGGLVPPAVQSFAWGNVPVLPPSAPTSQPAGRRKNKLPCPARIVPSLPVPTSPSDDWSPIFPFSLSRAISPTAIRALYPFCHLKEIPRTRLSPPISPPFGPIPPCFAGRSLDPSAAQMPLPEPPPVFKSSPGPPTNQTDIPLKKALPFAPVLSRLPGGQKSPAFRSPRPAVGRSSSHQAKSKNTPRALHRVAPAPRAHPRQPVQNVRLSPPSYGFPLCVKTSHLFVFHTEIMSRPRPSSVTGSTVIAVITKMER